MNNSSSRLRFIIISILATGVVIMLILSLLSHTNTETQTAKKAYSLPGIFTTATQYGSDSLIAVNGRAFVQYNYTTGRTSLVSDDAWQSDLSNVNQIIASTDKRYIAFQMSLAPAGSYFDKQLASENLSSNDPYWWVYDTTNKTYTHLPKNVQSVQFQSGKLYVIDNSNNQTITELALPSLAKLKSISVPKTDSFFVTTRGYLLENHDNPGTLLTSNGTVSTKVTDAHIIGVTSDGAKAIGIIDQGQLLVVIDMATKSQETIAKGVNGQAAWSANGTAVYTLTNQLDSKQPIFHVYNVATKKHTSITATGNAAENKKLQPLAYLNDKTFLATDSDSNGYLIGEAIVSYKEPSSSYQRDITVGNNIVDLSYYPDETAFIVVLDSDAADQERAAVYSQLKKDGFNPDLLDIRFTINNAGAARGTIY